MQTNYSNFFKNEITYKLFTYKLYIYMYGPPWGLSILAKEFTAATRIMAKLFERIEPSGIQ